MIRSPASPIDIAHPIGAQVAAVTQYGNALGDRHHLIQTVADKDGGYAMAL